LGRFEGEFLVVGLGRFGGGLAETLVDMGHDVLGVDSDPKAVQSFAGRLTHVVEADSTSVEAMRQLGAEDFPTAVVAIGTDIESSILTTAVLVDLAVPKIVAKAVTQAHGTILDYFQLDPGFALVETTAPRALVGKTLADAEVRRRYGITVVCIKHAGGTFTYATPDTVVEEEDILVVAGETKRAEAFGELS
jgi:trk system potassium uptake protein TrkA